MQLSTEGVLVLASAKGLEKEFAEKEFDYGFPEGLANLLDQHIIAAFTTNDGDDLLLEIHLNTNAPDIPFDREINQYLQLQADDELLLLSHADFTQICDSHKGNYRSHWQPVQKVENLAAGMYHLNIRVQDIGEDFDEYEAYFRLHITLNPVSDAPQKNSVSDIME